MTDDKERNARADRLYEQYGKPLEAEHWGEFVAIYEDGRVLLGSELREVAFRALDTHGKGAVLFKVGEKTVGSIR